jgi:hypothetical protein
MYGWEYALKQPQQWWAEVPNTWKPYTHFYNIPVAANLTHGEHPLRLLDTLHVKERDFVSFKLDIDTSEIEVPIALQLAALPHYQRIVDEFFFEFHFRYI